MPLQDKAPAALGTVQRLLIDGRLVEAGRTFPSLNPATGEFFGDAPDASADDAQAAVAAARRAFDSTEWPTDKELRLRCLDQLFQALTEHKEELRELTIAEVGATRMLTHGAQLDEPIDLVRYYADLLREYPLIEDLGEVEYQGQRHHRWVEKEAAGVVAAIIPYNFPIQLALAKLAPALAAGCTVVLKGPPDTPLVTLVLGQLIAEHTDIPPGVVNVVTSSEVAVGELLTTHPDVDVVSFTGSTATGRRILAGATLVTGGERVDPGFFYAPTLLSGVDPTSEIAQDEVFGPVLAMIPYDDDDDAVRIANQSIYGLSGAIYGGDQERALALARRIRTGTFSINGGNYFFSDAPFGGYKQSGIGREKGVAGLEEFMESKTFGTVAG